MGKQYLKHLRHVMGEGQKYLVDLIQAKMLEKGGISIRQAAIEMKLSPGALSNILSGDRAIGAEAAIRIAYYLGLPPAEVLRLTGQTDFLNLIEGISSVKLTDPIDPYLYRVAREMEGLTPNQIKSIINIAQTFKETNQPLITEEKPSDTVVYLSKRKKKSA